MGGTATCVALHHTRYGARWPNEAVLLHRLERGPGTGEVGGRIDPEARTDVVEVEVEGSALSPELLESLEEPEAEPTSPAEAVQGADVVTEDLEWIRSFQPKGPDGDELFYRD